jgi:hypothetical protein
VCRSHEYHSFTDLFFFLLQKCFWNPEEGASPWGLWVVGVSVVLFLAAVEVV